MYFTFLVITYNHEDFILQHLESIKFQICNYGKGHNFQLIIADDCSRDKTIEYIKRWLNFNGSLFKSIKILENHENLGTCKNYVRGIRNIEGNYFKTLAGDDLYGRDNIFKAVALLKKYDIITTAVAPFVECKLYNDKKIHSRIYSMYKFSETSYKKIRKYAITMPMTPGVFIKKELLTDEILNFISKFNFIEDRSQNIKLYELNDNLKFGKYEKILVLYRHHVDSVTKTCNSKIHNEFNSDSRALYRYVNQNTSSLSLKFRNSYNSFLSNINNKKIMMILNFDMWLYRLSFLLNYIRYRNSIIDIISNSYKPNEKHLNYLLMEAKRYEK